MRRRSHALFAIALALGSAYAIDHYVANLEYYIYGLAMLEALIASSLPDIFEPAWTNKHRGGFHSRRALVAALVMCALGVYLLLNYTPIYSHVTLFVSLGYASHLMLDALTPAGLPR
ncbi:MAG: metal-dependent hydrolase [Euryarchaeota archaeon]|nr:metal-dependent hydrolase [Euryarchaeota archaeon]